MSLSVPVPPLVPAAPAVEPPVHSALVAALPPALRELGVRYCLWKGYDRPERVRTAAGDVDLLVDRAHAGTFAAALHALGFKPAIAAPDLQVSGIASFLGYDPVLGRLVHLHVHHRVIVGHAWETHYDLGCAAGVLATATQGTTFPEPSPAFAWILYVIRQTLRLRLGDALTRGEPAWLVSLQPALVRIAGAARREEVLDTLGEHLPDVPYRLFERCVDALTPGTPGWHRLGLRRELQRALAAGRMRPPAFSYVRRGGALAARALRRRPSWAHPRKRLAHGGATVALAGTDGSGKSTCAAALTQWLSGELEIRHFHLGRPRRSPATLVAGGVLRIGRAIHDRLPRLMTRAGLAHLELLRALGTARDRYRLYRQLRRFALRGGVAIVERFPLPEDRALVGPSSAQGVALEARGLVAWALRRLEWRYYSHMARPDHVFVLAVDPDTAVRRKTTEPADYVRARAERLWHADWSKSRAEVLDATRETPVVIAELKARVWRAL